MITVIFFVDLTAHYAGHCDSHKSTAIQEIRKSVEDAGLLEAGIQMGAKSFVVLQLPKNEKVLADAIYCCNQASLPYKTLWLNDVAEWRDGGKS